MNGRSELKFIVGGHLVPCPYLKPTGLGFQTGCAAYDHVWMHAFLLFWSNPRGRVESEGLMCNFILVGHWNPVKRVLWMSKSGRARRSFGTGFAT